MGYTRNQIVEMCQDAFQNKNTFYKAPFVNYRGITTDTEEYYTEVVAEFLCNHIEAYISGITCISRKSSYRTEHHNGSVKRVSNREEERIAKNLYLQSESQDGFNYVGEIIDYQTPLKSKAEDEAGKIDLLSFDGKVMRILELKKPGTEETMLRCVLEGFTYLKTADVEKLVSDFGHDPQLVEVKASPFVFCGSTPCTEMAQERPFLHKLMDLLDSKPYYIAGQEAYTVIENLIPGIHISESSKYVATVRERMQEKFPKELLGGKFQGKEYPHIFKKLEDNFIDGEYPVQKSLKGSLTNADIKYHYAEHLNSSQVMCISYFKKFFETEAYQSLLAKILQRQGIDVVNAGGFSGAAFEYILEPKEGTNFDFYLKLANGTQITWEIKFTESEFGRTTKQKGAERKYDKKYEDIYVPMLRECAYYQFPDVICDNYCCLETGRLTKNCSVFEECTIHEFYEYYQIRRNILYAKKPGDYVLFLTPRENTALNEEREYIAQYAEKWGAGYIRNIYWEDLLESTLQVVSIEPDLLDYYTKFKEKYFE